MHRFVIWSGPERVRARAESHDDLGCVLALDLVLAEGCCRVRPLGWIGDDPALLDDVCDWLRQQGLSRVVLEVDDDHEAAGTGFVRGEQHLRYESPLPLPAQDTAEPGDPSSRAAVREVAADDEGVAALTAAALLGGAGGRPSGSEILAGLARSPGVRAWAAGDPVTGTYVTQLVGATCHVAVAAHSAQAPPGTMTALVVAAAQAATTDGAVRLTATVAADNAPSRRLCERFGLRAVHAAHWWCRGLG